MAQPSEARMHAARTGSRCNVPAIRHAGPAATTRVFNLHEILAAGQPLNAIAFAREHELSARTVKRDIERLRDFHHAPIIWDAKARTYRYTAPFDLLTGLRLDADEILALVLARRTFAAWGKSPLGRTLAAALGKIARFAGSSVSLPADDLRALLFQPEVKDLAADTEQRHFARLLDDISGRREIVVHYRKPAATSTERRVLHPLHLAHLDHRWMLVAAEPGREKWKSFLLSRIQRIEATAHRFTAPPTKALKTHLAGNLGRFTGEKEIEVRLRFSTTAAPYVKERPWHDSQKLSPRPDGGAEVTLTLNNLIDVQRRILANGRHVEVLSPPELRQDIAAEIAALSLVYSSAIDAAQKTSGKETPGHPLSLPTR
jgi:predicted DNA-binding transcriptional regulator YafY